MSDIEADLRDEAQVLAGNVWRAAGRCGPDCGIASGLATRAADEIARLRDENARLREAFEWSPIETAPTDVPVLLYFPDRRTGPHNLDWVEIGCAADRFGATHWMALPPFPRAALGSAS